MVPLDRKTFLRLPSRLYSFCDRLANTWGWIVPSDRESWSFQSLKTVGRPLAQASRPELLKVLGVDLQPTKSFFRKTLLRLPSRLYSFCDRLANTWGWIVPSDRKSWSFQSLKTMGSPLAQASRPELLKVLTSPYDQEAHRKSRENICLTSSMFPSEYWIK
ncbi:unnamed protein product [Arctogadus glacialis]